MKHKKGNKTSDKEIKERKLKRKSKQFAKSQLGHIRQNLVINNTTR